MHTETRTLKNKIPLERAFLEHNFIIFVFLSSNENCRPCNKLKKWLLYEKEDNEKKDLFADPKPLREVEYLLNREDIGFVFIQGNEESETTPFINFLESEAKLNSAEIPDICMGIALPSMLFALKDHEGKITFFEGNSLCGQQLTHENVQNVITEKFALPHV